MEHQSQQKSHLLRQRPLPGHLPALAELRAVITSHLPINPHVAFAGEEIAAFP